MADIVLGIPLSDVGIYYRDHMASLVMLQKQIREEGLSTETFYSFGCNCPKNRNNIIDHAIATKAKYVLLVDNDQTFPSGGFKKLLDADKDVVGGITVKRALPFDPAIYKRTLEDNDDRYMPITEWEQDAVIEVDGIGGCMLLIKTDAFSKIQEPYFNLGERDERSIGNDFYFCEKIKAAGMKVYCHTGVSLGHIGMNAYTIEDYFNVRNYLKSQAMVKEPAKDPIIAPTNKIEIVRS